MANQELVTILRQGVLAWNNWRHANRHRKGDLDFTDADLANLNCNEIPWPDDTTTDSESKTRKMAANLADANFAGANLRGAKLAGANLYWCNMEGANLTDAHLERAELTFANLRRSRLRQADLRNTDIRVADFFRADLYKADLRDTLFAWRSDEPDLLKSVNYVFIYCSKDLAEALGLGRSIDAKGTRRNNLEKLQCGQTDAELKKDVSHNDMIDDKSLAGYNLSKKRLEDIDLTGWNLCGSICKETVFLRANLKSCRLDGIILDDASMCGGDLSGSSLKGASLRRTNLTEVDFRRAALNDANFEGAQLQRATLDYADLSGATLSEVTAGGASFVGAKLSKSNLRGAILHESTLTGAIFDEANLSYAKLNNASLEGAELYKADLRHSDVTGARFDGANLQEAEFQDVKGLLREAILGSQTVPGRKQPPGIQITRNCRLAFFDAAFLDELQFPAPPIGEGAFRAIDLCDCNLEGARLEAIDMEAALLRGANLNNAHLMGTRLPRAVLESASIQGADLSSAILKSASLQKARLDGVQAKGADFSGCDLRDANLSNAILSNANLTSALLRNAVLEAADLSSAKGLYTDQLAASNLNAARLPPDLSQFTALKNIEGITTSARGLMLVQILLCGYAAIEVAAIRDVDLITNRTLLASPVLDMRTPVIFFAFGCPALLYTVYLWTHFYLQHLWEELAQLPAIFPDSRKLYRRVYPWFLSAFVSAHFPILRKDRPLLTHVQIICTVVITWWLVPATIALLWARYLCAHDVVGTASQVMVFSIAFGSAMCLQALAGATLKGRDRKPLIRNLPDEENRRLRIGQKWRKIFAQYKPTRVQVGLLLFTLIVMFYFAVRSAFAIRGCGLEHEESTGESHDVWRIARRACVAAKLTDAEVSSKGIGWQSNDPGSVSGADLEGKDLRGAVARGAFMVKANLRQAHLEGADLSGADLRWADLTNAYLQHANLSGARLNYANLTGARLEKTDLRGAKLENVVGLQNR